MSQIFIRPFTIADTDSLVSLLNSNRIIMENSFPEKPDSFYTYDEQPKTIANNILLSQKEQEYSFGIFLSDSNELIGKISLSGVTRDHFQNAYVEYAIDEKFNNNGFASLAVSKILHYAFDKLHLHRVQAVVLPENKSSIRVLEKNNFSYIGLSKNYFKINGVWKDHYLFAITND